MAKLTIPKWAVSSKGKGMKMRIKSILIALIPIAGEIFNFEPLTESDIGFVVELGFIVVAAGLHIFGWIRAELLDMEKI